MPRLVIFLDDGGVMNDNEVRGPQWQHLVAEFFVPKLGGTPDAWTAANEQVITRMLRADLWQARLRAAPDYRSFDRHYQIDWLRWIVNWSACPRPPMTTAWCWGTLRRGISRRVCAPRFLGWW